MKKSITFIFTFSVILISCNQNNPQPTSSSSNTTSLPCETVPWNNSVSYGSLNDIDGNSYKTVQIGSQTWMAENLKTTKYSNGDDILTISPIDNTSQWYGLEIGATTTLEWLDANNDTISYQNCYGNYYNYYTVLDNRNVCPNGWHVPSKNEFEELLSYSETAIQTSSTATALKAVEDWTNGSGTDDFGFRAMPAGYKYGSNVGVNQQFSFTNYGLGNNFEAFFWSSDTSDLNTIITLNINNFDSFNDGIRIDASTFFLQSKSLGVLNGLPIRCVKD